MAIIFKKTNSNNQSSRFDMDDERSFYTQDELDEMEKDEEYWNEQAKNNRNRFEIWRDYVISQARNEENDEDYDSNKNVLFKNRKITEVSIRIYKVYMLRAKFKKLALNWFK